MDGRKNIDYLAIGHICYDLTPQGMVIGGASAYAAGVARTLGCRTAVVSSNNPADDWSLDLPGVDIAATVAPETTIFENVYSSDGRHQTIHARAGNLSKQDVPADWLRPGIAHIVPIIDEVDPEIVTRFSNSLVGLSPQGWMRRWDVAGRVSAKPWRDDEWIMPLAAVTFLSREDLSEPADLDRYIALAPILVLTSGANGCTVYFDGVTRDFRPPPVDVVETTGAGDIFAAAYLVRLKQTAGDPWEAARFATNLAAESVTVAGLSSKMAAIEPERI